MKNFKPFVLAITIGLLIVGAGLGFLFGLDNPASWALLLLAVLIPMFFRGRSGKEHVRWQSRFSLGIEEIDAEHRQLVDLLNRFHTAYRYHTGEEFERAALDELVDYTKTHFEHEERMMQEHEYPDFEAHKLEHDAFFTEVEGFVSRYEARGYAGLEGVSERLCDWLINHICETDSAYVPYLAKKES